MLEPDPIRSRSKFVLAAGFVGLVALLVALGFFAANSLRLARTADPNSAHLYLERREALGGMRNELYSLVSHLRDYLLDPDDAAGSANARLTRETWEKVQTHFRVYRELHRGMESHSLRELESEMRHFWEEAEKGLSLSGSARRRSGYTLLSGRVTPQRQRLLSLIEKLATDDQLALRSTIQETAAFLEGLQTRLWVVISLSIGLGLGLAGLTYRHVVRLEAEAAERYRQSLDTGEQLEQLSHRLLAVQEEERKSIARELHDEVGQSLGAMLVDLGQQRYQAAAELAERTMRVIRDISLLLRPSMIDDLGLVPALHWQAREVNRRTGMNVTVQAAEEDLELDDEHRITVFRVVQEALQNASRHAQARNVEVGVARRDGMLHLLVRDDGRGFDPARTRGMGLLGMQERAVRLGGRLRVSSQPGHGTTITVDLPLSGGPLP